MAKRYELPDAAWNLVADIFSEPRRNGRPRADDRLSQQEYIAMPLPITPSFERDLRDLRDLRALSLGAAALLEQIAKDLQPQVLPTSTDNLEEQLLDHLQAVGR